jgi:hypothetical protein
MFRRAVTTSAPSPRARRAPTHPGRTILALLAGAALAGAASAAALSVTASTATASVAASAAPPSVTASAAPPSVTASAAPPSVTGSAAPTSSSTAAAPPSSSTTAAPPSSSTAAAPPPATASAPASTAPLPTVEQVLARSVAARGGIVKLRAVTTRRETGTLELAAGAQWPFTVEHKRPKSLRMEIQLQGAKLIRAYDGLHGWQLQPQSKNPEPLTADDLHNIANEADFDFAGGLVDTGGKASAELLGRESLAGHDAYKVKVVLLTGDVQIYWLDAASYLPVHLEAARLINGKLVDFRTDYGDFRDVGGIKYPFLVVTSMKTSHTQQKMIYSTIENNPPIDDSRFTDGAAAGAAPAAQPGAASPPKPPTPATPPPAPQPPAVKPPAAR